MMKVDAYAMLAGYLRRLDAAGIAHIGDADELAAGIMAVCRALIRSRANEEKHDVQLLAVFSADRTRTVLLTTQLDRR